MIYYLLQSVNKYETTLLRCDDNFTLSPQILWTEIVNVYVDSDVLLINEIQNYIKIADEKLN